jgi:hypothetical protein
MLRRKLSPRSFLSAALVALPVLFVATEASAQECLGDGECGQGFSCETVVTSAGFGNGGAAGTSGVGGTGAAAGTGSSTGGFAGTGGTGAPLPTVCNDAICQTGETPENCPSDCKYSTVCAPATCTNDFDCAGDYYCPPVGSVGTGGGPNVSFCGDLLCTPGSNEDQFTCPFDCDPNYRRCSPGYRGCQANTDCPGGYVCTFYGGTGGASGSGGTGASGAPAGGQSSDEAPATGGIGAGGSGTGGTSGTGLGGGAGTGVAGSGTAGVPQGGSSGIPAEGVCTPGGGGSTGGSSTGGTSGTSTGAVGNGPNGGTGANGNGGTDQNSGDEGETIVTHGGCALSRPNASSPFALLLVAFAALLRFGRKRSR